MENLNNKITIMTKLSIPKQAIAASKMGYAAQFASEESSDIGCLIDYAETTKRLEAVMIRESNMYSCTSWPIEQIEKLKITSYTFVGNLFGEPKIKVGQKFRVKATGEILTANSRASSSTMFCLGDEYVDYHPSELEPYFD